MFFWSGHWHLRLIIFFLLLGWLFWFIFSLPNFHLELFVCIWPASQSRSCSRDRSNFGNKGRFQFVTFNSGCQSQNKSQVQWNAENYDRKKCYCLSHSSRSTLSCIVTKITRMVLKKVPIGQFTTISQGTLPISLINNLQWFFLLFLLLVLEIICLTTCCEISFSFCFCSFIIFRFMSLHQLPKYNCMSLFGVFFRVWT